VRRKKQGFGFPLGIWMRSELRCFLERLFSQSRMVEQGIFDGNYVRKLLREHVDGKADHNYRLWLLLNLEIWHRLYIESESVETLRTFVEELSYSHNSRTPQDAPAMTMN
jgi:asparagine synthase (glutamine-hydrolysing)